MGGGGGSDDGGRFNEVSVGDGSRGDGSKDLRRMDKGTHLVAGTEEMVGGSGGGDDGGGGGGTGLERMAAIERQ